MGKEGRWGEGGVSGRWQAGGDDGGGKGRKGEEECPTHAEAPSSVPRPPSSPALRCASHLPILLEDKLALLLVLVLSSTTIFTA